MQEKLNEIPKNPEEISLGAIAAFGVVTVGVWAVSAWVAWMLNNYIERVYIVALIFITALATWFSRDLVEYIRARQRLQYVAYATKSLIDGEIIDIKRNRVTILLQAPGREVLQYREKHLDCLKRMRLGSKVLVRKITRYDAADREIDNWYEGIEGIIRAEVCSIQS